MNFPNLQKGTFEYAVFKKNYEDVERLIDEGQNPSQFNNENMIQLPLVISIKKKDIKMFNLLLRKGADPLYTAIMPHKNYTATCFTALVYFGTEEMILDLITACEKLHQGKDITDLFVGEVKSLLNFKKEKLTDNEKILFILNELIKRGFNIDRPIIFNMSVVEILSDYDRNKLIGFISQNIKRGK